MERRGTRSRGTDVLAVPRAGSAVRHIPAYSSTAPLDPLSLARTVSYQNRNCFTHLRCNLQKRTKEKGKPTH